MTRPFSYFRERTYEEVADFPDTTNITLPQGYVSWLQWQAYKREYADVEEANQRLIPMLFDMIKEQQHMKALIRLHQANLFYYSNQVAMQLRNTAGIDEELYQWSKTL